MPREFFRSDRVAAQLHRELADMLRTSVRDAELGMVTVSDVEVTRDLSVAKVYVTFLGGALAPADAVKRLARFAPELRHELGRRIRIRVMPELRFLYDESIARGERMDALLASLDERKDKTKIQ